jgi:hypothetical protein
MKITNNFFLFNFNFFNLNLFLNFVHNFDFHGISKVVFIFNGWFIEIVVLMTEHHLFEIIVEHINFFNMFIIVIIEFTSQMHPKVKIINL